MIGWYIHHQGRGHLHRALALSQNLAPETPVTGLSSLPKPQGWPGEWVHLSADYEESAEHGDEPPSRKPTARGALHWAPLGHPGLQDRSAQLSAWIRENSPGLLIADVSVEVALLARLHGVPVVTVALPGDRTDAAHQLGYRISEAVLGFWPEEAEGILHGLDGDDSPPFSALGGLSRFAPCAESSSGPGGPHIVVLNGGGGGELSQEALAAVRDALPEAELTVLGGAGRGPAAQEEPNSWAADPWPWLEQADVVITSAGQNAVAEVAASRTAAVVVAQDRPHREQISMQEALLQGPWPAVAAPVEHTAQAWDEVLRHALSLDGGDWASWCDGHAAQRFEQALRSIRAGIG